MLVNEIVKELEGQWSLTRTINNKEKMKGLGSIMPLSHNQWTYREEGIWHTTHTQEPLTFFQQFIYEVNNPHLHIINRDGTILHSLDFVHATNQWTARDCHQCKEDRYDLTFTVWSGGFQTHYDIAGPKKKFSILTLYRKAFSSFSRK